MKRKTAVTKILEEIESHRDRLEALAPHLEFGHEGNLALETLEKIIEFIDESSLLDEETHQIKGGYIQGRKDGDAGNTVKYENEDDYYNHEHKFEK